MKALWPSFVIAASLAAGCTKPNPAVCCLNPADCSSIGAAEEMRTCPEGLACVDHECVVAECSTQGCTAQAPVCNVATNVCEGCAGNADCSNIQDQGLCEVATGSCVQCIMSSDCGISKPVCEGRTCRGCERDSECSSGACAADGTCLAVASLVYIDPAGTDSGDCPQATPCRSFPYALSKMSVTRNHLVMRPGAYEAVVEIFPEINTPATSVVVHGGGATLSSQFSGDSPTISMDGEVTIKNLNIVTNAVYAITANCSPGCTIERSTLDAGVFMSGKVTFRDVVFDRADGFAAILTTSGAHLVIDRATIKGSWEKGIASNGNALVDVTNLLVHGTSERAIDLPTSSGTIAFSTIADSGTDTGSGPRAVSCGGNMTIRSSIIWAPGGTPRASVGGCNLVSTIAGPTAVPGAMNTDPQFVDRANRNYHLAPNSPAKDAVDTGPAFDFEGDVRPRGLRFDLGADEVQ